MKWYQQFLKRIKDLQFLVGVSEIVLEDADFDVVYYELFEKNNGIPRIHGKDYATFEKRPMTIFGTNVYSKSMKKEKNKSFCP